MEAVPAEWWVLDIQRVVDFYVPTCACTLRGAWMLQGVGNRQTLGLSCIRFQWLHSGVSGQKEKEESTVFLSVQGWDPHV